MKEKLVKAIAAISATMMLFGMTAFAAPKTMSDGGTFDPEYYAQQNPDVVAALGTDENVLYQHYLNNGKAEGRLPYATEETSVAATATRTRKYVFNSVDVKNTDARNTLAQKLLYYRDKESKIILQEMSDGTVNVTITYEKFRTSVSYVFANTGNTGGLSNGYVYVKTASSDGKSNDVRLLYDDTVIGLMTFDSNGYYMYGETYYEELVY